MRAAAQFFELVRGEAGWTLKTIYRFKGVFDSIFPTSRVVFGPDGGLYGTTNGDAPSPQVGGDYGSVYELTPPSLPCANSQCPWTHTALHRFLNQEGGSTPPAASYLVFDGEGNIYGTTEYGGSGRGKYCNGCGTVYELSPAGDGWSENVLHSFNDEDGYEPDSGLVFGADGALYGETDYAIGTYGQVYRLVPSESGWTEQAVYRFGGGVSYPGGGVIFDAAGNIYGTDGGFGGGSVFELTPSGGGWSLNVVYGFRGNDGPVDAGPVMDAAGNIYGTTNGDGAYEMGTVYKLTPTSGGWIYTDLHDFRGTDGEYPVGNLVLDTQGNIYGTTELGGGGSGCGIGCGVVWEITPE